MLRKGSEENWNILLTIRKNLYAGSAGGSSLRRTAYSRELPLLFAVPAFKDQIVFTCGLSFIPSTQYEGQDHSDLVNVGGCCAPDIVDEDIAVCGQTLPYTDLVRKTKKTVLMPRVFSIPCTSSLLTNITQFRSPTRGRR